VLPAGRFRLADAEFWLKVRVVPGGNVGTWRAVLTVLKAPIASEVPAWFRPTILLRPRVLPVKVMAPFVMVLKRVTYWARAAVTRMSATTTHAADHLQRHNIDGEPTPGLPDLARTPPLIRWMVTFRSSRGLLARLLAHSPAWVDAGRSTELDWARSIHILGCE
jgi:hypothetical protein